MRDLLLDDVLGEAFRLDVEPGRGDQATGLDRVAIVLVQRDQLAFQLALRELQRPRPAHRLDQLVPGALQVLGDRGQLVAGGAR